MIGLKRYEKTIKNMKKINTARKFELVKNMLTQHNWVLNINTYLEGLKTQALMEADYELAARIRAVQLSTK